MNRLFFYILLALCFFPPLAFKSGIYDYANSVKLAFLQVSSAVLLVVWAYERVRRQQFLFRQSPLNLPLLCLAVLLTVSACLAGNRYEALVVWQHWIAAILCFFVILNGLQDHEQIDTVLAVLFASGLFVALVGICQYLLGMTFVPQTVPPAATFGNKNMAARYVMLTLPFGVYLLVVARHMLLAWSVGIAAALMAVFLIYTGTRGAWLACVAELVFMLFFLARKPWQGMERKYSRNKVVVACVAFLLFFVLINLGPQGFQWRLQQVWERGEAISLELENSHSVGQGRAGSVGVRLAIWRNTLEMIKDYPLGVGLGNHKIVYPLYHRKILVDKQFSERIQLDNVHNDYLQFVAEVGLAGIIILLWLAAAVGFLLYRNTSPLQPAPARWRTGVIGMSLTGLAVNALVSFPMQMATAPFFLVVLFALLAFQGAEEKTFTTVWGRQGNRIILVSAVLILCWSVVYQGQRMIILKHFYNLRRLERQADWDGVLREHRLVSRYFPEEKKLLFYKAEALLYKWLNREAASVFEDYLVYYPNSVNALRNLGVSYYRLGEMEKALKAYERYLEIIPDSPAVNSYRRDLLRYKKMGL
jgi:O-antigen ligase